MTATMLLAGMMSMNAWAQNNPFQKEGSALYQQLQQQQLLEQQKALEAQQEGPDSSTTTMPAAVERPSYPLPFDLTPEMLLRMQMQGQQKEEEDFKSFVKDFVVIAVRQDKDQGARAVLRYNDYTYFVRNGGWLTHEGRRFRAEIDGLSVNLYSPNGTLVYAGEIGSGLTPDNTDDVVDGTSGSNSSSSNNR